MREFLWDFSGLSFQTSFIIDWSNPEIIYAQKSQSLSQAEIQAANPSIASGCDARTTHTIKDKVLIISKMWFNEFNSMQTRVKNGKQVVQPEKSS
jgi:hypothetical protein